MNLCLPCQDLGEKVCDAKAMGHHSYLNAALATADCVVVATDHSAYNWTEIARRARVVVDTRHVMP